MFLFSDPPSFLTALRQVGKEDPASCRKRQRDDTVNDEKPAPWYISLAVVLLHSTSRRLYGDQTRRDLHHLARLKGGTTYNQPDRSLRSSWYTLLPAGNH